jgi:hypothetical protein
MTGAELARMAVVREGHLGMFLAYHQRVVERVRDIGGVYFVLSISSVLCALREAARWVEDLPEPSESNTDWQKRDVIVGETGMEWDAAAPRKI